MSWQCTCPKCGVVNFDDVTKSLSFEVTPSSVIRTCTIRCRKCENVETTQDRNYYQPYQIEEIVEIKKRGRPKQHTSKAAKQRAYRSRQALRNSTAKHETVTK